MQVTKKIIAPLLIMVLLAGIAGIMSSREISINRAQKIRQASENPELLDFEKSQPEEDSSVDEAGDEERLPKPEDAS